MLQNFFRSKLYRTILFPLLPMLFWGSLFPLVKIGYQAFAIDTSVPADILMFAAVRFLVCGAIVCGIAGVRREALAVPRSKSIPLILFLGLFSIVLHYSCSYLGLSTTDSSKTALLKQLGPLLYTCFAFLFLKEEKFSLWKIFGAVVGFLGIVAINVGGGGSVRFSTGDLLILGASVCSVAGSILSKWSVKGSSPYWVVGISQLGGGAVLCVVSLLLGGKFPVFDLGATVIFGIICAASILGYTTFYVAQKHIDNSTLFIIKFAEPLFACFFGAVLLGENIFRLQYLAAAVLITAGILLGNKKSRKSAGQ